MGSCWPRGFTTRGDRFALFFFALFEAALWEEAVDFLEGADFFVVAVPLLDGDFLAGEEEAVLLVLDLETGFLVAADDFLL